MNDTKLDDDYYVKCVIDWIEKDDEFFHRFQPKKRRFYRSTKIDYWSTAWGEMLKHPHIKIPRSRVSR